MEPISRQPRDTGRRLRGAVIHRLGVAIVSADYAPGDILPSEAEFSEALDVSRTAYRDAIRTLAAKGLVESRPRTGTRVQPRHRWNLLDPDVLGWAFSVDPDMALVRGLFELRSLVEPGAAAMAAERRSDDDVAAMRAALTAMALHGLHTAAGQAADRDFHDAILNATGNDYLSFLTTSIGAAVTLTTQFKQRLRALPRDPIPDHRRVFDAIAMGDPVAASTAMRTLVDLALDDTRQAMI
ncbi:GntR family transcriptional regulator [Sphingomonas sp. Leaf17]|uniref:FadR/GntR family transcriptional regulator n=1 Tax=Sphingomonas sp. Leaf17 TaxID=1735683 RepID=UPI0006F4C18B|nr:FadR/GntR family transcriptional regulator [Sphingomonas sp. Leaf17]KQM67976.1 GntR family transcriptional regulator [Sphingomonas sp. Leaf17]